MSKTILEINQRPKNIFMWFGFSLQHLFTMFGATVLVPILVGIDPSIALFSSGIGTIAHLIFTKFKIPAYMGSSFAYIATMTLLMKNGGQGAIAQGAIASGLVYLIVALIVKKIGSKWIDKIMPPVVVAPIIIVIGLGLASVATKNAAFEVNGNYNISYVITALITAGFVIFYSLFLKGIWNVMAILLGIISGYIVAVLFKIVDFNPVLNAPWFQIPAFKFIFTNFSFHWNAIILMAPIAFVTMSEHIGHILIFNEITGKNFFKEPGLDKTLGGDGIAQILSGFFGSVPVTSYGENIGVQSITKIFSVYVIFLTAVLAICVSFIGKISALILSIPSCVIGGVSFVLFGVIATSGLKIIVTNKIDYSNKKNLLITSVVLVIGIGNLILNIKGFELSGMSLATLIAVVLNLVLPNK